MHTLDCATDMTSDHAAFVQRHSMQATGGAVCSLQQKANAVRVGRNSLPKSPDACRMKVEMHADRNCYLACKELVADYGKPFMQVGYRKIPKIHLLYQHPIGINSVGMPYVGRDKL